MATIEATIALFDGATPTLARISLAALDTARAVESVGTRARAALTLDPAPIVRGVEETLAAWRRLVSATRIAGEETAEAVARMTARVESAVDRMVSRVGSAVARVQGMLAAVDGMRADARVTVTRAASAQSARETVARTHSTDVRNLSVTVDVGGVSNYVSRDADVTGVTEAITRELTRAASAFAEGVC